MSMNTVIDLSGFIPSVEDLKDQYTPTNPYEIWRSKQIFILGLWHQQSHPTFLSNGLGDWWAFDRNLDDLVRLIEKYSAVGMVVAFQPDKQWWWHSYLELQNKRRTN